MYRKVDLETAFSNLSDEMRGLNSRVTKLEKIKLKKSYKWGTLFHPAALVIAIAAFILSGLVGVVFGFGSSSDFLHSVGVSLSVGGTISILALSVGAMEAGDFFEQIDEE